MVVMRVYSVEAQCSMQRCLRNAVDTLGFWSLEEKKHPLFSVLFDNGKDNTDLAQNIEPYFLNEFNLLDEEAEGRYTLKDRLGEPDVASLSYADLLNVPMILILVDKGRTGDTFPHTLGHFDLRIRTAGDTYSTFEQELGRLCRYQSFRRINCDGKSGCSHEEAITLGEEVSVSTEWSSTEYSNVGRGNSSHAQRARQCSPNDCKCLIKNCPNDRPLESQALERNRVVKVSSPSGKHLGVADTRWQLKDILKKTDAPPCVNVEESKYELPTMLITTTVMDHVHAAINEHRRSVLEAKKNGEKTISPISKSIRLKQMDQHMTGGMQNVSLHNWRTWCPYLDFDPNLSLNRFRCAVWLLQLLINTHHLRRTHVQKNAPKSALRYIRRRAFRRIFPLLHASNLLVSPRLCAR